MSSLLGSTCSTVDAESITHKGSKTGPSIYDELGVRTLINGQGVVTFYSCTLMPPEVHRAMERASEHYVEIVELQRAVGERLAKFVGAEAAMVCSGSAACIAQATAGCIAGMDPDKMYRLPDTEDIQDLHFQSGRGFRIHNNLPHSVPSCYDCMYRCATNGMRRRTGSTGKNMGSHSRWRRWLSKTNAALCVQTAWTKPESNDDTRLGWLN